MQPAPSIRLLVPFLQNMNVTRVLDYGAGTLRNATYLAEKGFRVDVAETWDRLPALYKNMMNRGKVSMVSLANINRIYDVRDIRRQKETFDLVICTFVLNVISYAQQVIILQDCWQCLREEGLLFVEVKEKREKSKGNALTCTQLNTLSDLTGFRNWVLWRGRISLAGLFQKR